MTAFRMAPVVLGVSLVATVPPARAGQPLFTDDAAVVAPQTCQLEAWTRSSGEGREYWAQPACNFTGNLELTIGGARVHPDDAANASLVQLQAKTVVLTTEDSVWSFGAVGGAGRDTGAPHGSSAFQLYYAKALASWYPQSDLEIDLNLGAANGYASGTFGIAGAAIQYTVVTNLQLLAEVFRGEPGNGRYQVGARWIVVPNQFEAYVSYGSLFHGSTDRWSAIVGIRLQTPAFLP